MPQCLKAPFESRAILAENTNITIVIDVFRAFTTACYVLEGLPADYFLTTKSSVVLQLAECYSNTVFVGKPEIGSSLRYHIPNSPTRVKEIDILNKTVIHRTEAGSRGVIAALEKKGNFVLAAGLVNADATADYVLQCGYMNVDIQPMGHEAQVASLEDDVCAEYIAAKLQGRSFSIKKHIPDLQRSSGKYFFADDQWQYPQADFARCLHLKRFNFAIRASAGEGYAILERCDTHRAR